MVLLFGERKYPIMGDEPKRVAWNTHAVRIIHHGAARR